ncbi:hypothetical protein F5Y17DRAFT_473898 [Xylariaceae sp. FL0594]|nr:hypothetical protein F5Y17DRAFT_473898 [Xylariaceae sp. FL0594]
MAPIPAQLQGQLGLGCQMESQFTPMGIPQQAHLSTIPRAEQTNSLSTSIGWQAYLVSNNYVDHFAPLRGTERTRYMPIIEEARTREARRNRAAVDTFRALRALEPKMNDIHQTHDWTTKTRRGRPKTGQVPGFQVFQRDRKTLSNGLEQLDKYFSILHRLTRHNRERVTQMHQGHFKTRFGVITACTTLAPEPWYMGYRPGDPIVRIKRAAGPALFHVPELAAEEDSDGQVHRVRFEGVVPFDYQELYQRFTKRAYGAFVQMVVVALSFDATETGSRRPLPIMKNFKPVIASEFDEVKDKDRARQLSYLQAEWKAKYGDDTSRYPQFLQDQVKTSISRFREMGWLMSKMERMRPLLANKPYWRRCRTLLQAVTGLDAVSLARDYFDKTLAAEIEEMLEDEDTEDVFFYHQTTAARALAKLQDFYDEDFEPHFGISDEQLRKLDALVTRYKSIRLPTQEKAVTTPANPSPSNRSEKRARPAEEEDGDDQSNNTPPAKRQRLIPVSALFITNNETLPYSHRRKQ